MVRGKPWKQMTKSANNSVTLEEVQLVGKTQKWAYLVNLSTTTMIVVYPLEFNEIH